MSILYNDTSYIAFHLMLTEDSFKEFKEILSRGLHTAPPEKWAEWIKLLYNLSDQPINQP